VDFFLITFFSKIGVTVFALDYAEEKAFMLSGECFLGLPGENAFLSLPGENAFVSFGRQKVYPDDKRFSLQCWHFKRLASFSKMIRNRLNVFIKHMISNCRYLLIYFLIRKSLHFSILAIINFSLLIINYLVWYLFETKFIDFK